MPKFNLPNVVLDGSKVVVVQLKIQLPFTVDLAFHIVPTSAEQQSMSFFPSFFPSRLLLTPPVIKVSSKERPSLDFWTKNLHPLRRDSRPPST